MTGVRIGGVLALGVGVLLAIVLLSARNAQPSEAGLKVVTTVAPLANIVVNVGGSRIGLRQIIPDGSDSHTFELAPADARLLTEADLIVLNGLHLEESALRLAEANKKPNARVLRLGDSSISRDEWIFDFSFPADQGDPNPHLWMNPLYAARYAELVANQLQDIDPANAVYYQDNAARFAARAHQLDEAIGAAIRTIPERNRRLLTYHDSFAYFAPRYGLTVIGAIQPSDFAEPTPRELAALIDQLKAEGVPAIFGSEVFPSKVLERIGQEAGVRYVDSLRDDDLPGAAGAPEHTYFGMMLEDVATITEALGGDPSPLAAAEPTNTFQP